MSSSRNLRPAARLVGGIAAALCQQAWGAQVECVSFDYPPMVRRAPDGLGQGLAVDLVSRALAVRGHQVRTRLFPWGRALAMVEAGQADCIFTIYFTSERAVFLDYSQERLDVQTVYLYGRAGVELAINGNVDLLMHYRIGTARNVLYGTRFEAVRTKLRIDEASTIAQSFAKLALGRVDLVPSSGRTAAAVLAQPSMASYAQQIVRLPIPIETVISYVGFSRRSKLKGMREEFDAGLRELVASGEYARLFEKHHQEE